MKRRQINNFPQGIGYDVDGEKLSTNAYRKAVNLFLTEEKGAYSLSNIKGSISLPSSVLTGSQRYVAAFNCRATFGPGNEPRDAFVIFSTDSATGVGMIYILDSTTDAIHKIYDGDQKPSKERMFNLDLGPEIDAFVFGEGDEYSLYWIDDVNPLRQIQLHVEDDGVFDNSTSPNSVLYIPNEPDLLWAQRLWPVDQIQFSDVYQEGGGLLCASYQFSYRYYNTETGMYSCWSLIENPIPIIQDNTQTTSSNDIMGYLPGAKTSKSIRLILDKNHFHHTYYDSIQLGVVRNMGTGEGSLSVLITSPSKEYYGSANTQSIIIYTGNENATQETTLSLTVEDAAILTGKTIEQDGARLFIGDIKYYDLTFQYPSQLNAYTKITEVLTNSDPMVAHTTAIGRGYYDEGVNHLLKGYFREEVYRFGRVYVNRFGHWAKPVPFDFSDPAFAYDPGNHGTTWQKNWATLGTDWKFLDRQSSQGTLFSGTSEAIRAMGLRLEGLDNHPDWAFAQAIVRLPRQKNILGQSPVINSVGYQGGGYQVDYGSINTSTDSWSNFFYLTPYTWDYDGSEDFFGPKIMAMGVAKNLTHGLMEIGAGYASSVHYLAWERAGVKYFDNAGSVQYDTASYAPAPYKKRSNQFLFLYPLEYMANAAGEEFSGLSLNGTESIKVIDCVALKAFNAYRDNRFIEGNAASADSFINGQESSYVWIFSPDNKEAYYYYNGHAPGSLLNVDIPTGPTIPLAPSGAVRIAGGYKFDWGAPTEILPGAFSNDEAMRHIRKLINGTGLATDQADNSDDIVTDGIWKPWNLSPHYPITNQRGLAIFLDGDELVTSNTVKYIYDPTWYLAWVVLNGYEPWANFFGGSTANIHANAYHESYRGNVPTTPEWDLTKADFAVNKLVEPGSTIPVFIANITLELGDDRYGPMDQSQPYIFTGAYSPITFADIDGNVAKSFNVYGGDCFITRNTFQLRDNAIKKDAAKVEDTSTWPIELFVGAGYPMIEDTVKATTYINFVEIIDLWVESTINGHYIYKGKDAYPKGIASRDAGNEDYVATPVYSYPENTGLTPYTRVNRYLYNFGYSVENPHKVWTSKNVVEQIFDDLKARVHFSEQKILNSSVRGFDQFLTGDYFDLDATFSGIIKLVRKAGKRLVAIQEDGIAILFLGTTLAEDEEGLSLNLSSGRVIGYAHYVENNDESMGDMGGQHIKAIKRGGHNIYVFDAKRSQLIEIGAETPRDISAFKVEDYIGERMTVEIASVDPEKVVMGWDNQDGRIIIYNNEPLSGETKGNGITFIPAIGAFETALMFSGRIIDFVTNGQEAYMVMDTEIHKLNNADRSTLLGENNAGYVEYVLNNGADKDVDKVLVSAIINSEGSPATMDAEIIETGESVTNVPVSIVRHNNYIYNQFNLSGGKRIRNAHVLLRVHIDSDDKVSISSIKTDYRIDPRT